MATITGQDLSVREINAKIKNLIAQGETEIAVEGTAARHNFGVAILQLVKVTFDGSVGYYCAGLNFTYFIIGLYRQPRYWTHPALHRVHHRPEPLATVLVSRLS